MMARLLLLGNKKEAKKPEEIERGKKLDRADYHRIECDVTTLQHRMHKTNEPHLLFAKFHQSY